MQFLSRVRVMHHVLCFSAHVGILLVVLSWAKVRAQDVRTVDGESHQGLGDAQSAWERFRHAFKLTYAQIANTWPDPENKSKMLQNLVTIKLDSTRYVGVVETAKGNQWEGEAFGKNDRYRFQLRRNSREQPWVIVALTHEPGNDVQARWIPQTAMYPLMVNAVALDELSRHPVFQVTGVQKDSSAGLVDVRFRISDPSARMSDGAQIKFTGGRVSLDPTRSWLPVRTEVMWASGTGRVRDARDFQTETEVSYPTKLVGAEVSGDGSASEADFKETVEKVQLGGSVPYREFTLSAFGLPEPAGSRGIPGYVWLAVISVVLLAVGAVLRTRARR